MWPFATEPKPVNYNIFLFYLFIFWFLKLVYTANKTKNFNSFTSQKTYEKLPNLDDIIGLQSVKQEMRQYMNLIKNNFKYLDWKVKLPKGILLVGPPGTGKTLLVKALAKEMKIPIITASGSDFVEKYVGVGAARIRALFKNARKHKFCIIFIDEIDAVGSIRNISTNSERAGTLNQLLVEMDGFNSSDQILLFAATNLSKFLDPALLRSGRFDKKIFFDLPNKNERLKLFELYLRGVETTDINTRQLAESTPSLSGADISNIANQSKLNAIQANHSTITKKDINSAVDEIMIGREKRERTLLLKELTRVAHHEAGHALIAYLLKKAVKPLKISIIPRGEFALGFSQDKPHDYKLRRQCDILNKVAVLYAGRAAEKIIYNDYSTGAADDIEKATSLLSSYIKNWGMSGIYGPINPDFIKDGIKNLDDKSFILIQNMAMDISSVVNNIVRANRKYIIKLAELLLKKETIYYRDLENIVPKRKKDSYNLINLLEI